MINEETLSLIRYYEGLRLKAYPDPATHAEPYTIGFGTTVYPSGKEVRLGDVITKEQAEEYFRHDIEVFAAKVKPRIKSSINDNQLGALVSFAYNVGITNLINSSLLKKVNSNPADLSIKAEFMKWNKANGQVMSGLTKRRNSEALLYFKK